MAQKKDQFPGYHVVSKTPEWLRAPPGARTCSKCSARSRAARSAPANIHALLARLFSCNFSLSLCMMVIVWTFVWTLATGTATMTFDAPQVKDR